VQRVVKAGSTAQRLAERVDALAAALREAGVPPEQAAGLLASAATATMHAVMLDALLDDRSVSVETATALAA
jgi:non-ribosomal peptide synthetase component F